MSRYRPKDRAHQREGPTSGERGLYDGVHRRAVGGGVDARDHEAVVGVVDVQGLAEPCRGTTLCGKHQTEITIKLEQIGSDTKPYTGRRVIMYRK